jgi:hypothetical protein
MSEERKQAAQAQFQKLLDAGVMREVEFFDWLANVLPKKNGKWVHARGHVGGRFL